MKLGTRTGFFAASVLGAVTVAGACAPSADKTTTSTTGAGGHTGATATATTATTGHPASTGQTTTGGHTTSTGSGGAGTGGSAGSSTTGGGAGSGGSAGSAGAAGHFLCPDPDPFGAPGPNTTVVTDAIIMADTTWSADQIWALSADYAVEGFTLTIDPGTVVCFGTGASIRVGDVNPGTVLINGTPSKHVTFTSTSADGTTPDFFGGIELNQYQSSVASYLDIFYGGEGGGGAAPAFDLSTPAGVFFLADHVTVAEVQSEGLRFSTSDYTGPSGLDPASVLTLDGYHTVDPNGPPLLAAISADMLATGSFTTSTLVLNAANIPAESAYIDVSPSPGPVMNSSVTWVDLGLPYRLADVDVFGGDGSMATAANFTIHEGVTVQLTGNIILGDLLTQTYGNLIVKGTAAKPVVFTSSMAAPMAGDWGSIYFFNAGFDPAVSTIAHAEFHYGGGSFVNNLIYSCTNDLQGQGEVEVDGTGAYAGPPITSSLFADSLGDGIRAKVDVINGHYITNDYSGGGNTFMNIAGHEVPPVNPPDLATCMQ